MRTAKAGHRLARQRLALRCHSTLMQIISSDLSHRLRAHIDADDVIQEVYTEIIRSFDDFAGNDFRAFRQWTNAIARNKIRELHRRFLRTAKRGAAHGPQQLSARFSQSCSNLASMVEAHITTVAGKAVKLEAYDSLAAALALLPAHYREVVELRYLKELSVEETAARTGRSRGSILMITHRAMRQLATTIHRFPLLTQC
ncbi:MAG: RNA polymerase sigma factor [Planctomycetota bacterium]